MWQYFFIKKAIDCPAEHKTLCREYHIYFEDEEYWDKWEMPEVEKFKIVDHRNELLMNRAQPCNEAVTTLDEEIREYDKKLQPSREKAIE
jgi:hypothetical protein